MTSRATQAIEDVYWVDFLTDQQKVALGAFRALLDAEKGLLAGQDDDVTLCRFLRARRWEAPLAAEMYRAMCAWRLSKKLDDPTQPSFAFPEEAQVKELYPHFYHKTDIHGRPVYYELLSELNPTQLFKATTLERMLEYHVSRWELCRSRILPACSAAAGRRIVSCTTILDLKNVGMAAFTSSVRSFVSEVAKCDQSNYPEHLGQMFIVNAPVLFSGVWAIIKPWLEARTQKKIQVISNAKQVQQVLLSVIPRENLLERFGGTSVLRAPYLKEIGPWNDFEGEHMHSGLGKVEVDGPWAEPDRLIENTVQA